MRKPLIAAVVTLLTSLAGTAVVPAPATADVVVPGQILTENTTWTADSGPYQLTGTVQIPAGVTLTIAAGAIVEAPDGLAFLVAGTLRVDGAPEAPVSLTGTGSTDLADGTGTTAVVDIDHAKVRNFGRLYGNSGGDASYSLTDSDIITTASRTDLRMYSKPVTIARNTFDDFRGFLIDSFGTDFPKVVTDNRFRGTAWPTSNPYVTSNYMREGTVTVTRNTFEPGPAHYLEVDSGGSITAHGNYWGHNDYWGTTDIDSRILDSRDDISRPTIYYQPSSVAPSAETRLLPPAPPSQVVATAGNRSATISWAPPISDGGAPVTAYSVQADGVAPVVVRNDQTSLTVSSLTNGTAYIFTVTAHSAAGASRAGTSPAVTPFGPPTPPTNVHATPGDGSATVSWDPDDPNGSSWTRFDILISPGDRQVSAYGGALYGPLEVFGLANGVDYTFRVVAHTATGRSEPSVPSAPVRPRGAPIMTGAVRAMAGERRVALTWDAADPNGSPVTGYRITADHYAGTLIATVPGDQTSHTVTGLRPGCTYRFAVTPVNSAGADAITALVSDAVVPYAKPGRVGKPDASVSGRRITLRWSTPPSNGARLSKYVIKPSKGRAVTVQARQHKLVFTKAPGRYSFTVTAYNRAGAGPASRPVTVTVKRS